MKKHEFHIGPGAASLILVAVVVSMGILGLLTMVSAHTDASITERNRETVEAQYNAYAQAEQDLRMLDELVVSLRKEAADDDSFFALLEERLPDGMELDEAVVSWDVPVMEKSVLHCSVRVSNTAKADRIAWVSHKYESFADTTEFD